MKPERKHMKLKGKRALITGGNSGIGLATARLFIAEGAEVAITGRNQETIDAALKELGPKAIGFRTDVTDSKGRKEVLKQIGERFGKLDIVFANAGIPGQTPAGGTAEELFEEIVRINLTSVFFTIQDALPYLNDGGSVVLNGSVIGTLGQPGYAAYAATKAGVRAIARSLAADLSPRGIRVNVVSPGATKTPIWGRSSRTSEQSEAIAKKVAAQIPLGRWGEAEEIAKAVLFLASDDASYVQGAELFVDGGLTASPHGGELNRV
jgi:NAD(P)-dependent dehydrogenase (short-subunit alcohol dehydrogenase family)